MPRLLMATTVVEMADHFLEELATQVTQAGWSVDLATNMSGSTPRKRPYSRVIDVPWGRGFKNPGGTLHSFRIMSGVLRHGGYQVVHTHSPTASAITRLAAPPHTATQIVYTAHGFHFGRGQPRLRSAVVKAVELALLRRTDVLVAINAEDYEWGVKHAGRVRVIRSRGVGVRDEFYESGSQADARTISHPVHVAVVGELCPRKRPLLAVDSVAKLPGGCDLTFAGEGELHSRLEDHAAHVMETHPNIRIRLVGQVADVPQLLRKSDLLLHTSAQEGLPTVVLESLAAGTPVVAVEIRGTSDILRSGGGCLVAPNPEEIAHAVEHLSAPEVWTRESNRARAIAAPFRRSEVLGEMLDLYSTLVENGSDR